MENLSIQKVILPGFLFLMSTTFMAQQGAPISDVDVLAQQKEVMIQHYPDVFKAEEIKKIEKIDDKHSKVYYQRGGANFEAIVNSDRKDLLLVATCEQIQEAELPKIVTKHFHESKRGSDEIKKAFVVKTPTSSDFYRLDITDKSKKVKSIFYDNLGMEMQAPY